jgi:hypothetical protein
MIAKGINIHQLKGAIKAAFIDDGNIAKLYDPHKSIASIDDIIDDIYKKVSEFRNAPEGTTNIKGVFEKNELIGYYVNTPSMLISFSINTKYRTRHYLKEFYSLIKKDMNKRFVCYLFSKNIRAIKWLQKMGMKVTGFHNIITELRCQ